MEDIYHNPNKNSEISNFSTVLKFLLAIVKFFRSGINITQKDILIAMRLPPIFYVLLSKYNKIDALRPKYFKMSSYKDRVVFGKKGKYREYLRRDPWWWWSVEILMLNFAYKSYSISKKFAKSLQHILFWSTGFAPAIEPL